MKTVLRIFRDDIHSLSRRFFALALIVGISVLPALYAWVNIYANGDPYANTGGIKIALASKDPGVTLDDGTVVNKADEVLDEKRNNDKIGWEFPASAEEAVSGVESGKYYAAIVFNENFTYDMYHFEEALADQKPAVTYYGNEKKNAVAAKICESAAASLQTSVRTKYLETVFSRILEESNELADEIEKNDSVDIVIAQLENLRNNLMDYDDAISSFLADSKEVKAGIRSTEKKLGKSRASARKSANKAKSSLTKARKSIAVAKESLEELRKYRELTPDMQYAKLESFDQTLRSLDAALGQLGPLSTSMTNMLNGIDPVLEGAGDTVESLDGTLKQSQKVIRASADDISGIISEVRAAENDDRIKKLAELLGGDPEEYAEFFSSLVDVEEEKVYQVASYGAAMSPFYSILAVWVGGVILVSVLKTHIDRKKYPEVTEAEGFFGRFILFFLIGQVQAAVIVAGDIWLLHCDPVHPVKMWFAAAVASFVFVLLIYALTLSFGDIGKAFVVVIMVVQISGSSGSFPIEILPAVYGKIYKFFPFPYAINAMREGLCGTYGNDYYIYLAELLLFAAAALAIGLLVRRPFISMNEFVTEKLEETEVL